MKALVMVQFSAYVATREEIARSEIDVDISCGPFHLEIPLVSRHVLPPGRYFGTLIVDRNDDTFRIDVQCEDTGREVANLSGSFDTEEVLQKVEDVFKAMGTMYHIIFGQLRRLL